MEINISETVYKHFGKNRAVEYGQKMKLKENQTMENTFNYTYSAKENAEILEICKKYLPQCESKLEELKRLDKAVQAAGTIATMQQRKLTQQPISETIVYCFADRHFAR